MCRLSVNVNKIATLRNARGGNVPDLVKVALDCEKFGAQGITVHPRPDERHIRYTDVKNLKKVLTTEFNIEGYPNSRFIDLVLETKPEQVTLVPDPPGVLTSNAGWKITEQFNFLSEILHIFKEHKIRTSLFIGTELEEIRRAKEVGADRIEFYTGPYAESFKTDPKKSISPFIGASKLANDLGLGINAGHDLDLKNLNFFKSNVENLLEVSIGHAIISDALYFGLENTINMYLRELRK